MAKSKCPHCGFRHGGHDMCLEVKCATCGKEYWATSFERLASGIMKQPPICSKECMDAWRENKNRTIQGGNNSG